jgi:hypothetical protein
VPITAKRFRSRHRSPRQLSARLHLESLEPRNLLSGNPGPTLFLPPNETLDPNQLKELLPNREVVGILGQGPSGAADVDWYHFHLDLASDVTLRTLDQQEGRALVSVLSLYNTTDPYNGDPTSSDYYERLGHHLLAQASGTSQAPNALIRRYLGPGDYYVAVSGAGNLYFNPFLAGSGFPGSTGYFALTLSTQDLGLGLDTPAVVAMDPGPSGPNDPFPDPKIVATSPFMIRVDLSSDVNLGSFDFSQVQLLYNSSAPDFGADAGIMPVNTTYSLAAHELQLNPMAALAPGYYEVVPGVDNPLGLPLIFHVTGQGGNPPANGSSTQIPSHDLGMVQVGQLVQVPGMIGDDFIDGVTPFDSNEVQMYHFQVSGTGQFQITAEVFANRIGSPLNAALALYRLDGDNHFDLVAANADTTNQTKGIDRSEPLYQDPEIDAGLMPGDYYLAVSSGLNVPDAAQNLHLGDPGVFDPNNPAQPGWGDSTGTYVLNFMVQPHQGTPHVVSVSRDDGIQPGGSPAFFTVQFDEPVNVQQLAYQAYQTFFHGGQDQMPAVYVEGPGGPYFPRLESYDPATNTATFIMLDGLANGPYRLHLAGGVNALHDLAGNPLAGNGWANGDYVFDFTVNDPAQAPGSNPQIRFNQDPNTDPQNLGIMFPLELLAPVTINGNSFTGVVITRDLASHPSATPAADTQDVYEIQVLHSQTYVLSLDNQTPDGLVDLGCPVISTDPAGKNVVPEAAEYDLDPGIYYIHIGSWDAADAGKVKYDLHISMVGSPERPTPLTLGAAPAISIHVVSNVPPPPPPTSPPSSPSGQTNSGNIPSTVLVSLASGSLGSNSAGNIGTARSVLPGVDVLDRVVAQAPRFLRQEELLQVVSLLQTLDHTNEDEATENPAEKPPADNSTGSPFASIPWQETVETFFRWWTAMEQQMMQVSDPVDGEESQLEEFGEELDETGMVAPDSGLAALALGGLLLSGLHGRWSEALTSSETNCNDKKTKPKSFFRF